MFENVLEAKIPYTISHRWTARQRGESSSDLSHIQCVTLVAIFVFHILHCVPSQV